MPTIPHYKPKIKYLINTDELKLVTLNKLNRIIGFDVTYKGENKKFMVDKKYNVLKCFEQVEDFINKD